MQRKADSHMRKRLRFVTIMLSFVAFAVIAGKIFYLQVFKYEDYQQRAIDQQTKDKVVEAHRGSIYDKNMKPLAVSVGNEMVTLEAVKIDDEEQGKLIAETLSTILEMDYDEVMKRVEEKSTYCVLKRNVEKEKTDLIRAFIKENKIDSIYMVDDTSRYYPYGNFLSHTIGFVGSDNQGLYGLEAYYDDVLDGVDGRVIKAINTRGDEMPFDYEMYYDAKDGNSLVLTIDEVIQHYLEKNLEKAYTDNKVADHVTGIIMDVNTGAILAMANKPDFDLNHPFVITDPIKAEEIDKIADGEEKKAARSDVLTHQWINRAITDTYSPGSTFKIITASSALEQGVVSTSSTFSCPGYRMVSGWHKPIRCWKHAGHGEENFAQALMNSCNPAFMDIGARLGIDNFYKYFEAFGLKERTGIDLPGENMGRIWDKSDMSQVDLAVASFGQNFEITPMQLMRAVAAVANGGTLVTPHVVDKIIDEDGNTVSSASTNEVRQVISKETSETMCGILQQVVSEGTGKNAYTVGYRVAGKTGTTEKIAEQNQSGRDNLRISSFIAFAPADDPQIAVLVLLDEPTVYPVTGGITVAPVIRRIMENVMPYLEVEPVYTPEEQLKMDTAVPNLTGMNKAQAEAAAKEQGFNVRFVGEGDVVTSQMPASSALVSRSSPIALYMGGAAPEGTAVVPDLRGMGVSAARSTLLNSGLYYRSSGTEYATGNIAVRTQDIPAGTEVPVGTVISIDFADLNQLAQ